MFTAMIIACHIASADSCMTATDNRGPYETAERCEQRIVEMVRDVQAVWKQNNMPMVFRWTGCIKNNKGEST